jgi:hypothetical protein
MDHAAETGRREIPGHLIHPLPLARLEFDASVQGEPDEPDTGAVYGRIAELPQDPWDRDVVAVLALETRLESRVRRSFVAEGDRTGATGMRCSVTPSRWPTR